jgi:hypothetical protein
MTVHLDQVMTDQDPIRPRRVSGQGPQPKRSCKASSTASCAIARNLVTPLLTAGRASGADEADVDNRRGADELDAPVARPHIVEVVEEPFAAAEQDRRDHVVHLVDQACPEVLLDGGRAPGDPDVPAVGGRDGSVEGCPRCRR